MITKLRLRRAQRTANRDRYLQWMQKHGSGNEPSHQQQRFSNVYHAVESSTTPTRPRKQAVKADMPIIDLVEDERGEAYYGVCVTVTVY